MDNQFEPLSNGEVLSVDESALVLIGHRTFRVGEFAEAIREQLEGHVSGWSKGTDAWFSDEGIPCEVLRFSSMGWQKGKVRIHLEFCPQDFEEGNKQTTAKLDEKFHLEAPTSTEDELDLEEAPISSSAVFGTAVAATALTDTEDELDLVEPESTVSSFDEFDLEPSAASNLEMEQEAPSIIYARMEQEVSTFIADDELDMVQMPTGLDDDFDLGEMSDSIEQELELVEAPAGSDEDLMDFGSTSTGSDDDFEFGEFGETAVGGKDDLDFGDMSAGSQDEFQFEDISLSDEFGENEPNSLLDDVWQDINEGSWPNNH
ncbi:MAG TPA: KGK domain-containing protein [Oculatellaceae cyanobacterium]